MKRFQTLPSLLSVLFVAGTFVVTGCNPGTISGPEFDADYSVQIEANTDAFSIVASDRDDSNEHNNLGGDDSNEHNNLGGDDSNEHN